MNRESKAAYDLIGAALRAREQSLEALAIIRECQIMHLKELESATDKDAQTIAKAKAEAYGHAAEALTGTTK